MLCREGFRTTHHLERRGNGFREERDFVCVTVRAWALGTPSSCSTRVLLDASSSRRVRTRGTLRRGEACCLLPLSTLVPVFLVVLPVLKSFSLSSSSTLQPNHSRRARRQHCLLNLTALALLSLSLFAVPHPGLRSFKPSLVEFLAFLLCFLDHTLNAGESWTFREGGFRRFARLA